MAEKYFKAKKTIQYHGQRKITKDEVLTETELNKIYPSSLHGNFEPIVKEIYDELLTKQQKENLSKDELFKAEIMESLSAEFEQKFKIQDKRIKDLEAENQKLKAEGKK